MRSADHNTDADPKELPRTTGRSRLPACSTWPKNFTKRSSELRVALSRLRSLIRRTNSSRLFNICAVLVIEYVERRASQFGSWFVLGVTLSLVILQPLILISPAGAAGIQDPPAVQSKPDQDDDVVRVSTDLVVLNVTVLDNNGKFVTGLKRLTLKF